MANINIDLDLDKTLVYSGKPVKYRMGENRGDSSIIASIFDHGTSVDVTKMQNVFFKCMLPDGKKLIESATIVDNTFVYKPSDRFNKMAGVAEHCYFEMTGYSTQEFNMLILLQ